MEEQKSNRRVLTGVVVSDKADKTIVVMLIRNGQRLINSRNWTELVKPEMLERDPASTDMRA